VYKLQFFTYIFAALLPDLSRLSCHSVQRMFLKMNTRHQAHKQSKNATNGSRFSRGSNCVSVPNFEAIAPTAAEIWRFFDFSRWWPPPSWIFQISHFSGRTAQEGRTASPCQIWLKSAKLRPRYGDISIFQDGGRAILDFSNFKLLTVGRLKRAELRRHAKFSRNRLNRGRDMAIF